MWCVQAVASLVKAVLPPDQSVDLLYIPGCKDNSEERDGEPLCLFSNPQAIGVIPSVSSRATDAILLTREVLVAMETDNTTSFTMDAVQALRRWAKTRHVYGTKYGFPGGSAWMVMARRLLRVDAGACSWSMHIQRRPALCRLCRQWFDQVTHLSHDDVLWHFLLTVAAWPWPLPFTTENMHSLWEAPLMLHTHRRPHPGRQRVQPTRGRGGWQPGAGKQHRPSNVHILRGPPSLWQRMEHDTVPARGILIIIGAPRVSGRGLDAAHLHPARGVVHRPTPTVRRRASGNHCAGGLPGRDAHPQHVRAVARPSRGALAVPPTSSRATDRRQECIAVAKLGGQPPRGHPESAVGRLWSVCTPVVHG